MNRTRIKVKYLLSMHKDLPEYPTPEDLSYEVSKWYWTEGGHSHIDNHTSVKDIDHPVFSKQILVDTLKLPEKKLDAVIQEMLDKNFITITRETQHNTYYRFETNDYK